MDNIAWLLAGLAVGLAAGLGIGVWLGGRRRARETAALQAGLEQSFGKVALDTLARASGEMVKAAGQTLGGQLQAGSQELEGKKKLIDQRLDALNQQLEQVRQEASAFKVSGERGVGEVTTWVKNAVEQTGKLREMLAGTNSRGQWGELMAEDVLRAAGFQENINYLKQQTLENAPGRPDYTFLLPRNLKVHLDVKFPLNSYARSLEAGTEDEKARWREQFMRDARQRVKEVTTREYIDPAGGTVDYALVLIPSEAVYAYLNEHDSTLLADSLRSKVVLCSPVTLYAVLLVIRQAVENYHTSEAATEILSLLGTFKKQWEDFRQAVNTLGERLESTRKAYDEMSGRRTRALDRPLAKIEELRTRQGIAPAELPPELPDAEKEDPA